MPAPQPPCAEQQRGDRRAEDRGGKARVARGGEVFAGIRLARVVIGQPGGIESERVLPKELQNSDGTEQRDRRAEHIQHPCCRTRKAPHQTKAQHIERDREQPLVPRAAEPCFLPPRREQTGDQRTEQIAQQQPLRKAWPREGRRPSNEGQLQPEQHGQRAVSARQPEEQAVFRLRDLCVAAGSRPEQEHGEHQAEIEARQPCERVLLHACLLGNL